MTQAEAPVSITPDALADVLAELREMRARQEALASENAALKAQVQSGAKPEVKPMAISDVRYVDVGQQAKSGFTLKANPKVEFTIGRGDSGDKRMSFRVDYLALILASDAIRDALK